MSWQWWKVVSVPLGVTGLGRGSGSCVWSELSHGQQWLQSCVREKQTWDPAALCLESSLGLGIKVDLTPKSSPCLDTPQSEKCEIILPTPYLTGRKLFVSVVAQRCKASKYSRLNYFLFSSLKKLCKYMCADSAAHWKKWQSSMYS